MHDPDKTPTLGDAVEDSYYASGGVRTGSAFNEALVSQRERTQRGATPSPYPGRTRSEPLFAFVDDWAARLPWSARWVGMGLAFLAGMGYCLSAGESPGFALLLGLAAAGLSVVGFYLLVLAIKLLLLALCLALVGGVAWGGYWFYTQFF